MKIKNDQAWEKLIVQFNEYLESNLIKWEDDPHHIYLTAAEMCERLRMSPEETQTTVNSIHQTTERTHAK